MFKNLINRIFRAIKIDVELYEEVERDKSATIQAGFVVVLSSMAAGVGALQLGASNFLLAPIDAAQVVADICGSIGINIKMFHEVL